MATNIFDTLGRVVEKRKGVATTKPTDYDDLVLAIGSESGFAGYATSSKLVYDSGSVGDGRVTSRKGYYGTGASDYIESLSKYTFRGHLRGVEQKNGTSDFGPWYVQDIDWLGRNVATATYDSEPTTWPSDYSSYVTSNSSGRFGMKQISYDKLGRMFQTESYPGYEGTDHFVTNYYYDRNNDLVAVSDPNGMTREMAYDGARRHYQTRIVKELNSTIYSSGAFQYNSPTPNSTFSLVSGGGAGGVVELTHKKINKAGNRLATHIVELDYDDDDGFSLSSGVATDGVRQSTFYWYDGADRLTTSAYYGTGDDDDGYTNWQSSDLPHVDPEVDTAPASSSANVLVTSYSYDVNKQQETVTDPKGQDTLVVSDDLGRRVFVAENHVDFITSGLPGGGTNNEEDRVTGFEYNGLGRVATLKAYERKTGTSYVTQETDYFYDDNYDASWATKVIYPDSAGINDWVEIAYALDGSVTRRRDQRAVIIDYSYDDARRLDAQYVSSFGNSGIVDQSVKSITRFYDDQGRVEFITSHSSAETSGDSGSGAVNNTNAVNQIKYTYDTTHGRLTESEQDHSGPVDGSTPSVQYAYDTDVTSPVYSDGLRMESTTYPGGRVIDYAYGSSGDIDDRLNRVDKISESTTTFTTYQHNGVGRLVERRYHTPTAITHHADRDNNHVYGSWDRFGREVTIHWTRAIGAWSPAQLRDSFKYTYDYAGNRTARNVMHNLMTAPAGGTDTRDQEYAYDGLHRLKIAEQGDADDTAHTISTANTSLEQQWTLDQLGNWGNFKEDANGDGDFTDAGDLDQSRAHNDANELTGISETAGDTWIDPVHDAAGNMTVIPDPQELDSGELGATYDAWNRLVQLDEMSGGQVVTTVQTCEYDGLNRRIKRVENSTTTHFYYNEQWQCLEERATEGGSAQKQYVWHPHYVDALAVSFDAAGDESYYLHDALFNVTAVMDDAGSVVERYAYDAYGECTVLEPDFTADGGNKSDIGNEHLYTGRRTDPGTGLQLNRYRYYHQQLGRWVNRDPIGYAAGDMNLYGYVRGKPTRFVDPLGLQSVVLDFFDQDQKDRAKPQIPVTGSEKDIDIWIERHPFDDEKAARARIEYSITIDRSSCKCYEGQLSGTASVILTVTITRNTNPTPNYPHTPDQFNEVLDHTLGSGGTSSPFDLNKNKTVATSSLVVGSIPCAGGVASGTATIANGNNDRIRIDWSTEYIDDGYIDVGVDTSGNPTDRQHELDKFSPLKF